jgi:UPF0755 protein
VTDIFDLGLSHHPSKPPVHRKFLQLPAVAVSLLVVVGIVFGGVQLAGKYLKPKASNDFTGDGTSVVQVEVAPGDTSSDIAKTLVAVGVVKSTTAFVDAAQNDPKSRDIQPGTYQLKLQMSAVSALALLEDPTSLVGGRLTIPEGTKLAKLKQLITSKSQIKAADLDAALANPKALGLPDYAGGKPEGFLFPATYNITSSTTAAKLLAQMVNRYKQVSNSIALEAGAKKLGLSPYQVVTIASLIEAEVKRPQDYAQVAEVIVNRLHRGMKLELDSTVNYALGTAKQFLTQSDLKVESAYNTYLHKGLPPTPIDSPGQAALQAALNPATGNLLYFVTVDPVTGETLFTNSISQFDKWRQQAQQNFSAAASAAAAAKPGSTSPP